MGSMHVQWYKSDRPCLLVGYVAKYPPQRSSATPQNKPRSQLGYTQQKELYLPSAASGAGAVAAAAEERKKRKYSHLDQCHSFVPVAIETTSFRSGDHGIPVGIGPSPPAGVC